jgi:hypothetical protein
VELPDAEQKVVVDSIGDNLVTGRIFIDPSGQFGAVSFYLFFILI